MTQFYFSVNIDNDRMLCVAPLTDRKIALSGQEVSDPGAYFLFEQRGSDEFASIEILAQLMSEEAAFAMRDMLKMS
ncbi:MAG TPA: hypothetical protein VJN67_22360 [Stellaceae bacterium]|nr:hypothetical protein [Stellaceae bacterium]